MPIYRNLKEFSAQTDRFTGALERAMFAGVEAAAFVTKKSVLESATAHGWPRKRTRKGRQPTVVVKYTIATGGRNPTARVTLTNGYVYERGAKEHEIKPKRRSKAKAVATPYGVFRHVHHPGFHGRPFWHQGVERARPVLTKVFGDRVAKAVIETFKR